MKSLEGVVAHELHCSAKNSATFCRLGCTGGVLPVRRPVAGRQRYQHHQRRRRICRSRRKWNRIPQLFRHRLSHEPVTGTAFNPTLVTLFTGLTLPSGTIIAATPTLLNAEVWFQAASSVRRASGGPPRMKMPFRPALTFRIQEIGYRAAAGGR